MLAVAALQHELDFGRFHRHRAEHPLVLHVDDVAARLADHRGDARQAAGEIGQGDAQPHQPAVAHQAAHQHRREQARIDVAAADRDADAPAGEAAGMLQQRGKAGGPGAFGHRLLDLDQLDHRGLDRFFRDHQDLVDELADQRQRQFAGIAHRHAFGDRVAADIHRQSLQALVHGAPVARFHAAHLDRRFDGLGGQRHAGNEPAAAHRYHERVERGRLLEHFQRHRALARDDGRIVVGMDEGEALARLQHARVARGIGERVALDHHLRAMHLRALDLAVGRAARHHDHRAQAETRRVVGHALRMVARAHRDDAAPARRFIQRQQPVERAALLERGGELQVLEFQPDFGAGELRQRAAVQAGRALDRACDALCRRANVVQGDRVRGERHG